MKPLTRERPGKLWSQHLRPSGPGNPLEPLSLSSSGGGVRISRT